MIPAGSPMARIAARAASAATATLLVLSSTAQPAFADSGFDGPPAIAAARPAGQVVPETAYEQKALCRTGSHQPNTDFKNLAWGQRSLDLDAAHKISTGAGVSVAVIDTGVSRVPGRLDDVEGGGDYIRGEGQGGHGGDTNGLDDCDLHGTFAAGLIAAKAKPAADSFVGVAPDARIISIRQASDLFGSKDGSDSAGTLHTLAQAVVHAADLGARVIVIPIGSCFQALGFPSNASFEADQALGAALKYAAEEKDSVVVTAAGNLQGGSRAACKAQNPTEPIAQGQAQNPADKAQWQRVRTVITPAWHSQWTLAVGWADQDGEGAGVDERPNTTGTLAGPWVGVAAPGDGLLSVNPRPDETAAGPHDDLADATPASYDGNQITSLQTIQGTSFATAYVAGAAALVRAKYPELKAAEVIQRLEKFSRHPENGWNPAVGYGVVDPVAALNGVEPPPIPHKQPAPAASARHDVAPSSGVPVLAVVAIVVVLLAACAVLAILYARARRGQRP